MGGYKNIDMTPPNGYYNNKYLECKCEYAKLKLGVAALCTWGVGRKEYNYNFVVKRQ